MTPLHQFPTGAICLPAFDDWNYWLGTGDRRLIYRGSVDSEDADQPIPAPRPDSKQDSSSLIAAFKSAVFPPADWLSVCAAAEFLRLPVLGG